MARNSIHIDAPPDAVFAVLADGHSYERWVVGCQAIRDVDKDWPAPGTRFYHRVGVGPLTTADYSEALVSDPPRVLVLRVRARPIGTAKVTLEIGAEDDGSALVMIEVPLSDWTRRLWNPVLDWLTKLRNAEALRRLKNLAEERATMGA